MARVAFTIGLLLTALAGPACSAAMSATAGASARIVESGSVQVLMPPQPTIGGAFVQVTIPLGMPSTTGVPGGGALFVGNAPSLGILRAPPVGNSALMIRRNDTDSAVVTAPASFAVVRVEGAESVILKTSASAGYGLVGEGVLMGGSLVGGAAASIEVEGEGRDEQVLAVVVHYN